MKVVVQQGADTGRSVRLARGLVIVGRGADCDLTLQEAQASRQHVELRRYGDQWLIVDLGSTNGTLVDGVTLPPQMARPLSPGSIVTIGGTHLRLEPEPEILPPAVARARTESLVWPVATWIARGLVLAGCVLTLVGSLSEWIAIRVQLPIVPIGVDRTFSGVSSGLAWLFIGLAVAALLLMLMDVVSRRWGLAAGLSQALLAVTVLLSLAVQVRQYYQAGTQKFLGISLVDVLTKYAKDVVDITPEPGIYALGAGLVALIVGGLLRLVLAGLEPVDSRV